MLFVSSCDHAGRPRSFLSLREAGMAALDPCKEG